MDRLEEASQFFLDGLAQYAQGIPGTKEKRRARAPCAAPETLGGLRFVDVQYGDTAAGRCAVEVATGARLLHVDEVDHYNDLEEEQAILEASDLLVSTSNVNAHLAGAPGKRTWLLCLADRAHFRYWAHGGSPRSLWSSSVEILGSPRLNDWTAVVQHAAQRLKAGSNER